MDLCTYIRCIYSIHVCRNALCIQIFVGGLNYKNWTCKLSSAVNNLSNKNCHMCVKKCKAHSLLCYRRLCVPLTMQWILSTMKILPQQPNMATQFREKLCICLQQCVWEAAVGETLVYAKEPKSTRDRHIEQHDRHALARGEEKWCVSAVYSHVAKFCWWLEPQKFYLVKVLREIVSLWRFFLCTIHI